MPHKIGTSNTGDTYVVWRGENVLYLFCVARQNCLIPIITSARPSIYPSTVITDMITFIIVCISLQELSYTVYYYLKNKEDVWREKLGLGGK